jgi:hypothetical protein
MRLRAVLFSMGCSTLLVGSTVPALDPPMPLGSEFQVNTYTTDEQSYPRVATDALGNFVVVWQSNMQDGSFTGVFGQRFDSSGSELGSEFQVNTYTTDSQERPDIAMDAMGNFAVVWESYRQDGDGESVFGQRFASTGAPLGTEFQINTFTTDQQTFPAVGMDAMGNFVVVWESFAQDGAASGIFGQRFDSMGMPVGTEFQVNTFTTANQGRPGVDVSWDGNFVVVWESLFQDGSDFGVFGQRFDSGGAALGTELQANTFTTDEQEHPDVSFDADDGFMVVWEGAHQDGSGIGILGRIFDSAGVPAGTEFQVNTYATGDQDDPRIDADAGGNFVVAWNDEGNADGSDYGVFAQRLSSVGAFLGSEFQVNTYTTDDQEHPAVAVAPGGKFVIAWDSRKPDGDREGVFAQRFMACLMDSDCDDQNGCTDDTCDQGACVFTNNADPCDDGLFCNGADTCAGGTCSVHVGNPCAGGGPCADTCVESNDSCVASNCAVCPECTACNDGNGATHNDRCHGAACFGNTGPRMLGPAIPFSLLGVNSTSVTLTGGAGLTAEGDVCARRTEIASNPMLGGRLIATRTNATAANFAGGGSVADGIFTGGGAVNTGNPAVTNPGGTFIAPNATAVTEVNRCKMAANRVAAAAGTIADPTFACVTNPAFPTNVAVANGATQMLSVTPGVLNVIRLTNLQVGINGKLVIKSGMMNPNTGVVINVSGLFRLRRGARIVAGAGVKPNQVLINVSNFGGTATLERDSRLEGTLIAVDRDISAGMAVITEGGLFGGITAIGTGPNATVGDDTYGGPLP